MNRVFICGNLGQDPELRTTSGSTAVVNLRVATNERRKGRDGEWTDHTEWHRVVAFGRQAESCGQHLTKGRKVLIEGRIQTRKWQDTDGNDRYSTEIVADRVHFVGGREESGGGGQSRGNEGGGGRSNGDRRGGGRSGGGGYGGYGSGHGSGRSTSQPEWGGKNHGPDEDIPF